MENTALKKLIGNLDIKTIQELIEIEEIRQDIKELAKEVKRGMFGEGGTNEEFKKLRAEVYEQ
ncbi:hypothetical protein A3L11_10590 [Thermococcus siculi]|uniref:Uncharacterized protein n=2 Tax=Thermococcus siculi TaxID=72803 RepID=A0A2Z2MV34_9EURY|nr:hypothetical protein A3L11_10590 [Thermococcus siculi]